MTAEERLAYFQGEKRRNGNDQTVAQEKNRDLILLKIKFFIAVVLFVAFLSLDYTGYEIYGIDSEQIVQKVITDASIVDLQQLKNLENFVL